MEPPRQKSGRLALNVITMGNHNQLTTLLDHQSKIGPLIHVNQTSLRTEENNTILQLGTNSIEFLSILRMWSFWMVHPLQLVMPKHWIGPKWTQNGSSLLHVLLKQILGILWYIFLHSEEKRQACIQITIVTSWFDAYLWLDLGKMVARRSWDVWWSIQQFGSCGDVFVLLFGFFWTQNMVEEVFDYFSNVPIFLCFFT